MLKIRSLLLYGVLLGLSANLSAETEFEGAARLIKAENFSAAQQLLDQALQSNPRNADALYWMGKLQWAKKDPEKAVEFADKAIAINPGNASYYVLRGNALGNLAQNANMFRAMGLASDSLESYEKAVDLEPGNRIAVLALFNYYFTVPAIAGGSLDKAQALAERTQAQDPSRAHYLKGLLLKKQKNHDKAHEEYRLAVVADPNYADAHNAMGYAELERKQIDTALTHFHKQVELAPDNANSYDSLGDGWAAKGNLDEAINAYRKALALNPLFSPSMLSLGKTLERAGRRDDAIAHYRQCVQLGTEKDTPPIVDEAKKRLKALGVKP